MPGLEAFQIPTSVHLAPLSSRQPRHAPQLGTNHAAEPQVPVPLECVEEHRKERIEPLATDAIGGLLEDDARLPHGIVVETQPRPPPRRRRQGDGVQDPNQVLAVIPRHRDELVEDPELLFPRTRAVPLPDRLHQFLSSCHADLLGHCLLHESATAGSRFREATAPPGNNPGEAMRPLARALS